MANRLTESGEHRVLLIEHGSSDMKDPRDIFLHMPTALSIPMNMSMYNWEFETIPEPGLGGRQLHCPRGKVMGGSSSINGMVFVRGNAMDFNHWEEDGCPGWGYNNCLPYFKRYETWAEGEDEYRGGDGPVRTTNGTYKNPLYDAFVQAGGEAGYPVTEDYNGYQQEGFGKMAMNVDKGVRASTANAYLRWGGAEKRPNLDIVKQTMVHRVLLEGGEDGTACAEASALGGGSEVRAVGVELDDGAGLRSVLASKEVVLCAGSIGSPQLLQMSGVGDRDHLESIGVPLTVHSPGVGANLQDHLEVYFQHRCTQPVSLYSSLDPVSKLLIGIQWVLNRSGLGATNHFESCGFIRSQPGVQYPDIQYHFLPCAASYDGNSVVDDHGFQVHVGPMRARSRGYVRARSSDPHDKPSIFFDYMSHPEDVKDWRRVIRLTREVLGQPALDAFRGEELGPGASVESDEEIDAWVKANTESAYHPSGTCRYSTACTQYRRIPPLRHMQVQYSMHSVYTVLTMQTYCRMGEWREGAVDHEREGGRARLPVVDSKLRVHGVDNLRVVSAHTVCTCIWHAHTGMDILAPATKTYMKPTCTDIMHSYMH
jgi:choline dehydrogenase